uniref:Uncharacterized protein n=1 Tax=candidate division CPR3 bacterium TaxID=2268181 RepID=A0A7V3JAM1_UNCC3
MEIPLPTIEKPDIYFYGFNKQLYRVSLVDTQLVPGQDFNSDFGIFGGTIGGSALVGDRQASTIADAINSSGNFIKELINSKLNTSTKQILGDFTFGASGAIKMITDANNGLWLSPNGILGKKAGATTFAVDTSGNATFAGTLSGASGTFGNITAGTISGISISGSTITGSTITGSTLQTGTSGKNVDITQGRISQRNNTVEVVYSDVGTYGGWWGLKDIDGNSVFYLDVENAGPAHNIGFRGDATYSNDWFMQCNHDIVFIMNNGRSIRPNSAGQINLGNTSNYWNNIYYKDIVDMGCLGSFDKGVELQNGKIVSDTEALLAIKEHPTKKTIYGTPMLDYSTFPKVSYIPATVNEKGERVSDEGVRMSPVFSIMIGAIKELTERVKTLERKING